jgi:DNA-binding NtrC family response regulator
MPRGLSLLRNIKQTYPTVQVILMIPSEEHSLSLSIEGMKLGAFNDLMIPFDVQTLVKHVDAAFAKKRQEENQSAADGHKGGAEIEDGTRADRRSKQGFGHR